MVRDVNDIPAEACTFAFAFSGQFILVEIMSEMEDMKEFPKAYFAYSLPFQAAAFIGVGLSVYYFRGDAASGMIVDEIPFGNSERYAAICLVGHMLITYVIKSVVLCRGLLKEFHRRDMITSSNTWAAWHYMVLAVLASSWLLAQIVPFFSDLVNVLGSTFTPTIAFMTPMFLYLLLVRVQDFTPSRLEMVAIAVEIAVSVVMLLYGAFTGRGRSRSWDVRGKAPSAGVEDFEDFQQEAGATKASSPARDIIFEDVTTAFEDVDGLSDWEASNAPPEKEVQPRKPAPMSDEELASANLLTLARDEFVWAVGRAATIGLSPEARLWQDVPNAILTLGGENELSPSEVCRLLQALAYAPASVPIDMSMLQKLLKVFALRAKEYSDERLMRVVYAYGKLAAKRGLQQTRFMDFATSEIVERDRTLRSWRKVRILEAIGSLPEAGPEFKTVLVGQIMKTGLKNLDAECMGRFVHMVVDTKYHERSGTVQRLNTIYQLKLKHVRFNNPELILLMGLPMFLHDLMKTSVLTRWLDRLARLRLPVEAGSAPRTRATTRSAIVVAPDEQAEEAPRKRPRSYALGPANSTTAARNLEGLKLVEFVLRHERPGIMQSLTPVAVQLLSTVREMQLRPPDDYQMLELPHVYSELSRLFPKLGVLLHPSICGPYLLELADPLGLVVVEWDQGWLLYPPWRRKRHQEFVLRKHLHLRAEGWKVVTLPLTEFQELTTRSAKLHYLEGFIAKHDMEHLRVEASTAACTPNVEQGLERSSSCFACMTALPELHQLQSARAAQNAETRVAPFEKTPLLAANRNGHGVPSLEQLKVCMRFTKDGSIYQLPSANSSIQASLWQCLVWILRLLQVLMPAFYFVVNKPCSHPDDATADCNHLLMSRAWRLITVAAVVAAEGGLGEEAALEFVGIGDAKLCCEQVLRPGFVERSAGIPSARLLTPACNWQRILLFKFSSPDAADEVDLRLLLQICETWGKLGPKDGLLTNSPKSLSPWWRSIVAAMDGIPLAHRGFAQFAAAVVQRVICDWWHTQGQKLVVGWSPMCGWTAWEEDEACDCASLHRDHIRRLFATGFPEDKALTGVTGASDRLFADGGFVNDPSIHTSHLRSLASRGKDKPWSRFLVRTPTIHQRDAQVASQVKFGERMATASLNLAEMLGHQTLTMSELLDRAGELRSDSASEDQPKFGIRRVFQDAEVGTSVSPLRRYGRFLPARRFVEPSAGPRTKHCAATVTSLRVDADMCRRVIDSLGINMANPEHNDTVKERLAGIYVGDDCLVVLTRTARSALDGLLRGWDCFSWYGQESAPHFDRMWGVILHASVLATEIAVQRMTQVELHQYRLAAASLDQHCELPKFSGQPPAATSLAWLELQRSIASLAWLSFNALPYKRGTPSTVLVIHHALWLALFPAEDRQDVLVQCIPRIREGIVPDLEAFSTDLDEFVNERWWHIFEELAAAENLLSCLSNRFEGVTRWKDGTKQATFDVSQSVSNPLPAYTTYWRPSFSTAPAVV
ncbi:mtr [Symbiodinium necroappetens]|uniref:Mtr protein n=1 Tax=Symbiodinium necroappetens TaxID=1628268 RepID=A0A812SVJ7_9DINO|nr:mtr [Symbiodinium necroappetens]